MPWQPLMRNRTLIWSMFAMHAVYNFGHLRFDATLPHDHDYKATLTPCPPRVIDTLLLNSTDASRSKTLSQTCSRRKYTLFQFHKNFEIWDSRRNNMVQTLMNMESTLFKDVQFFSPKRSPETCATKMPQKTHRVDFHTCQH